MFSPPPPFPKTLFTIKTCSCSTMSSSLPSLARTIFFQNRGETSDVLSSALSVQNSDSQNRTITSRCPLLRLPLPKPYFTVKACSIAALCPLLRFSVENHYLPKARYHTYMALLPSLSGENLSTKILSWNDACAKL
jgi:hypothetical protein